MLPVSVGCSLGDAFEIMSLDQAHGIDTRAHRRVCEAAPRLLGRKKSPACSFEHEACKPPSHIRAGIDIDAIRKNFGRFDWRVAMDHDFPEAALAAQEFVANPEQIFGPLMFEGNARPDAGMAQEIFTDGYRKFEGGQES